MEWFSTEAMLKGGYINFIVLLGSVITGRWSIMVSGQKERTKPPSIRGLLVVQEV